MWPTLPSLCLALSPTTRRKAPPRRRPAFRRPAVEVLEDRTVPTVSISVANASLNEIGSPSAFVTAGSGGLSSPFGITMGPDGNVYVAGAGQSHACGGSRGDTRRHFRRTDGPGRLEFARSREQPGLPLRPQRGGPATASFSVGLTDDAA